MTAFFDRLARRRAARLRTLAVVAALLAMAAALAYAVTKDRQALRWITEACVADARWSGSPFPCLEVDLPEGEAGAGAGGQAGGEASGYVIFRAPLIHDAVLVPTRSVTGVEDPFLASPEAPNYFAEAWRARSVVATPDGGTPAHDRILLFVNSGIVRTQDELHIHIGCLKPAARRRLASAAPGLPVGQWRLIAPLVPHQPFWLLRLGRADLDGVDPFRLVFEAFGGVVDDPAELTIAVAGATVEGKDDLVVLATYADAPGSWWPVGAESLLDSRCRLEPPPVSEGASAGQVFKADGT